MKSLAFSEMPKQLIILIYYALIVFINCSSCYYYHNITSVLGEDLKNDSQIRIINASLSILFCFCFHPNRHEFVFIRKYENIRIMQYPGISNIEI